MQPKHFINYACNCFDTFVFCYLLLQVAALILENTFTSILDMAGVLLPFLKWFIGGSGSKSPKILNFLVRSPLMSLARRAWSCWSSCFLSLRLLN